MNYKLVKEDKDFIYYETEYGIGFCASKHAYFHFQPEIEREETQSENGGDYSSPFITNLYPDQYN